jgi:6-phosphofructokinase 1
VRVGILTAGGDCPGLNAVIRAAARRLLAHGHQPVGLLRGYQGLAERDHVALDQRTLSGILHLGGTIVSTSSYDPFREPGGVEKVKAAQAEDHLDGVIAIGGEHTMMITRALHEEFGLPVVGVPKTIDNDVVGTDYTFGFDTAVQIATDAIDRLHTTAQSHDRVMVVEVMGRNTGWIAMFAGIASYPSSS